MDSEIICGKAKKIIFLFYVCLITILWAPNGVYNMVSNFAKKLSIYIAKQKNLNNMYKIVNLTFG